MLLQSGNSLLSTISSNDIEAMTVIKDAAAASLYGSRALQMVLL
ncbi:TonB-dependent receptor plug domain-containing protein [Bacteroides fragilis]|nr:TonB-dependent receptor plug domain-containing protein [Bacteroides fragilis]